MLIAFGNLLKGSLIRFPTTLENDAKLMLMGASTQDSKSNEPQESFEFYNILANSPTAGTTLSPKLRKIVRVRMFEKIVIKYFQDLIALVKPIMEESEEHSRKSLIDNLLKNKSIEDKYGPYLKQIQSVTVFELNYD